MPITNGRYVNPGWVNGQPPAINASELNAISDTLENLTALGGRRGGYVVVGTSTGGATAFDCDFLCDGTADDVEINAAIQEAQSMNLDVFLLAGSFNISNTINLTTNLFGSGCGKTFLNRTSISFQYFIKTSYLTSSVCVTFPLIIQTYYQVPTPLKYFLAVASRLKMYL